MSDKPDIQRVLDRWFEAGATSVPDRVLDRALETIDQTRQRRAWSVSWRNLTMSNVAKIGVAGVLILAVGAVAFILAEYRAGPPTGTSSVSPNPSASAQPTAPTPRPAAFTPTGSLTAARGYHTATRLADGRVLVAGGAGAPDGHPLDSAELYDPSTGVWSATARMTIARMRHTATLLDDGRVLVVGGVGDAIDVIGATTELFDPASGTWSSTGSLTTARQFYAVALLDDGRVLVAGGLGEDGVQLDSTEIYDPSSGTWSATGKMTAARAVPTATLLGDGKVLVAGGGADGTSTELYDPSTGTWSATGSLTTAREEPTATLLTDGKVLVLGSVDATGVPGDYLASVELYDPSTGMWSSTGSLPTVWGLYAVTLLADGKLMVAGGNSFSDTGGPTVASAELYDPRTGTWSATAVMTTTRHSHTATLLLDGIVLVVGGASAENVFLDSAELYDPGSGT